MTKLLPATPNLRHLQSQAKDLLELCQFGDLIAINQIRSSNPALKRVAPEKAASAARLCDAHLAVAHYYGFRNWPALSAATNQMHESSIALSKALKDHRMERLDFRSGIARCKGLPPIGTSRVSEYGVRYDVVDYMPAITPAGRARAMAGGAEVHINDLLPIISFPEMSDRLFELYIETDCVTTRPLLFFDTVPDMHPSTAAAGLNQVLALNYDSPLFVHFDASQLEETIIAHELGHIWVDNVDQIEDYRHPRDQSDLPRITQFYHVQSFVMDLPVNDLLERRGFDMSIIAQHQAEAIYNFAANCARGERPRNRRVLAAVINAIAGALLEMERFPAGWSSGIDDALHMIQIGLPEAFEPAKGFVRSVLRHGYADSAAVMRVVDECARLSFAATGESFDPGKDLIEATNSEPKWDKRPGFLRCLPLEAKLEVCREAARRGITGRATYDIVTRYPRHAEVVISGEAGDVLEPIRLTFCLPAPPLNPHLMPNAPVPNLPVGSAHIPPPGMPYPGSTLTAPQNRQHSIAEHAGKAPAYGNNRNRRVPFQSSPVDAVVNAIPDTGVESRRLIEQHRRKQVEDDYRRRLLQIQMQARHHESYSGRDLKPFLTPAGEEYAKMHPQRTIEAAAPVRNYMAGLGRWISQVGFEQQLGNESVYGYANNNPVTYIDPEGDAPKKVAKPVNLIGKQYTNCKAHTKACINLIFQRHGPTTNACYQGASMKNWQTDLMNCACVSGNSGADPLLLLAVAACETSWGTNPNDAIRCHNQFGWWFNGNALPPTQPGAPSIGKLRLCHLGPNRNTLGRIPTYKEAACATAGKIRSDGGINAQHIKSGDCISKVLPQWKKECKAAGI